MATTPIDLDGVEEKQLLQFRLCDLPLKIENTWLNELVQKLYAELEARGLAFRPPCYLGDEWFSPEGIPAIALPFYLAHPRLIQLERKLIGEAEGESREEAMRLLRHECGHAMVHAFGLTKRQSWRGVFGHPRKPFSDYYRYQPYSKSYVRNLKDFYAQSHPEEDFAETFAVWLNPDSNWRELYAEWPALKKLEYIDELVPSVGKKTITVPKKDFFWHISTLKKKLESHYRAKRKLYIEHEADFFDADLRLIFSESAKSPKFKASRFLMARRGILEDTVSRFTGEKKVLIRNLLSRLRRRCDTLTLGIVAGKEEMVLTQFTSYLTSLVSNHRYTNRYKPGK
ncbi:MAG: putative zinc-binding metallopeptidase [Leptospiraceae bacterium]|nr:putative zinc-binding metallopeptidase [Leptospiraceae bacterium]